MTVVNKAEYFITVFVFHTNYTFFPWRISRIAPGASLLGGFTITLRGTKLSRTPLESDQPDAKTST